MTIVPGIVSGNMWSSSALASRRTAKQAFVTMQTTRWSVRKNVHEPRDPDAAKVRHCSLLCLSNKYICDDAREYLTW